MRLIPTEDGERTLRVREVLTVAAVALAIASTFAPYPLLAASVILLGIALLLKP